MIVCLTSAGFNLLADCILLTWVIIEYSRQSQIYVSVLLSHQLTLQSYRGFRSGSMHDHKTKGLTTLTQYYY